MRRKDTKHCSKSLAAALCVTILIITIYTPPFFLDVTQQREKTLDHIYSAVNLSNRHIFTEYKITKGNITGNLLIIRICDPDIYICTYIVSLLLFCVAVSSAKDI